MDLLGFPHGDERQENLKIWRNNWDASNGTSLFELCVQGVQNRPGQPGAGLSGGVLMYGVCSFTRADPPIDVSGFNCKMPNPHSNAFIDLDGDCLAGERNFGRPS